jgi:hypothetical protein
VTTIAEVLHRAADDFLWDGREYASGGVAASCFAVEDAANSVGAADELVDRCFDGLKAMGVDVSKFDFGDFRDSPERQGARYAWLKFAAMIAEEQGV